MGLWLLETDTNVVGLILRCTLAVVIFPHGAQKVLGWFGGQGFKPTVQVFTSAGIPPVLALLAIAAEFLGPLGLAVGLLTRMAAFGIACVLLIAMMKVHWPNGFFMNWFGTQQGEALSITCWRSVLPSLCSSWVVARGRWIGLSQAPPSRPSVVRSD